MKVEFFIDRPIFSAVLSILIVVVGCIGLYLLPVDQYPQITPPMVKISASYPGASAQTVSQAVATPIEQELNGTPGMLYMESSSSNSGGLSINVTFDISANPELSAVEIQNRVKLAESRLPAEVVQNGISVEKQSSNQLMTLTLTSDDPRFDEIYLSNFATINVLDILRRIPGVGRVSNIGSRYYGMCIWVMPDRMANFGLTVKDLQDALKDQNRESAAGELGKQPISGQDITIPITTQGRLSTVNEFEEIVVRANPDGSIVRLRDVARVSLEASSYSTESGMNGKNAAVLGIYTLPGANAVEVAGQVRETMKEISKNFPEGLDYEIPFDITSYISESIHEVYKTLFEALLLVVLVVFLSLQNWRASLVPLIAVPISLIGTFGVMLVLGFSLNLLTLLGLILSIGIVVDDAIVVVEAVDTLMKYAAESKAFTGLSSSLQAEIPQLYFDVDRDKAKFLGIPMSDIFSTMKAYTGSVYVNDFNMFNRVYKVYIQAEAPYRAHKDNINMFFVKTAGGDMVPLTALGDAEYTTGPGNIRRFNMFTTAVVRGAAAPGYSSGEVMRKMENIAKTHLPENIGVEWSGLSYQEKKAEGQLGLVLTLVFLFVFLFLAALYESWLVPVAVLLSLPVAALGAYLGILGFGLENDIYFQIGLVTLIGLAAKNAILIVEFAKMEVDKGVDVVVAAKNAAMLRFRPILMTSLAFVLGMLPLVMASGPGSASRHSIGTGVFFGMIAAITIGIVLVPFFFVMVYKFKEKIRVKTKSVK